MKVRDRLIVAVMVAVVAIGAVWLLLVSPERNQASSLSSQIATEQAALGPAQAALSAARAAAAGYPSDVHQLAQVITAVPRTTDEPGLITTITKLAGTAVDVHELDVGTNSGTAAGPIAIGLTFTFYASYGALQKFIVALDRLVATDGTNLLANGRLFTIEGVTLAPKVPGTGVRATVTAVSYQQTPVAPPATGASGASGTAGTTVAAG
jgi:hypothetical protein